LERCRITYVLDKQQTDQKKLIFLKKNLSLGTDVLLHITEKTTGFCVYVIPGY
jgi:hypothetical protein